MISTSTLPRIAALFVFGGTLLWPASIAVAQATWALSGGGNWNVNSNWSGGVFPNTTNASAVFDASITNQSTITNSAPITIGSLSVSNANRIEWGTAGRSWTFATTSGPATISNTRAITNGAAGHKILAGVVLNTNLVITDSVSTLSTMFTLQGGVSGSGSLTKEGTGVLQTFNLSLTGGINLNNGTIVANGQLPSTGLVSVGDGTGAAGSAVLRIQTSGPGFSAAINTDGLIEVRATAVTNTAISGTGEIWIEPTTSRTITFTGTNTQTYSGIITGGRAATNAPNPTGFTDGRLTKTGTNTLILDGANTYASRTFIDSGAIRAASSTALGAAGSSNATYIHNTGALELTNSLSISEPLFLNGQGNGQGALRSVSGSNTVTGPVAIGWAGTGVTASNASLGAAAGSTLVMGTAITSTNAAIGLTKYGTGTVIFQGDNTYTGDTVVGQGTLRLEGAGLIADGSHLVVSNAATMQLNDISDTVRGVSGAGNVSLGSATLTLSNTATNHSFSGVISGTGAIIKSGTGTQVFSGTNTYSGATTIAGGTLRISGNRGLGNTNTTLTISNAGVLEVSAAGTLTNAITIGAGNGVISNRSAGSLVIAGAVSNTGATLTSRSGSRTNVFTGVISGASANSDFVVDGGTTVFSNVMTYNGPTIITNGGTLVLGVDDAMPAGSDLILGGGTFRVGVLNYNADSALSMGTLTVTANSTIDLGNFGTSGDRNLVFSNSSAITWATGTVLTITNWQGAMWTESEVTKLLFGIGGLTSTQLAQVRFANQNIDGGGLVGASGELVPIPEAPVVWGAVGVAAFIFWRERRRVFGLLRTWGRRES